MKCDSCGEPFDASEGTTIYRRDYDEGGRTWTITICPKCEDKRSEVATIIAWFVVVFAGVSLGGFGTAVVLVKLLW